MGRLPPLSGIEYSPGVGVDYWIWSVQIAGVGTLLSGINFFVTILKMRCPGMTLMKMPIFVWCDLDTLCPHHFRLSDFDRNIGDASLRSLSRNALFHARFGGNPMMYINLIWAWGHPEVYILILPAFGIFSEIVATFSQKRLFGYASMVWALVAITFLVIHRLAAPLLYDGRRGQCQRFLWDHDDDHRDSDRGQDLQLALYDVQRKSEFRYTDVLVYGIHHHLYSRRNDGVLMSIPPVDFQIHNSLFLVAHFHSMIIGGVVFGFFPGLPIGSLKSLGLN